MVKGRNRIALIALIVISLFTSQPQIAASSAEPASVEAFDIPATPTPLVQSNDELVIEPASMDESLSRPPAVGRSAVVDSTNPDWATVYGTEAGAQTMAPRAPQIPSAIEGATPPLTGTWRTITPQVSSNGITAIAYASDGRLFAGLGSAGLRVYTPDGNGIYTWSSIVGAPASVSALTVFGSELWIGTTSSGITTYNLTSNTFITTFTTSNSGLIGNAINRFTPVSNPRGTDYIWVSTNSGVSRYTPGRPGVWFSRTTANGLPSNTVHDTAVLISGTITTTLFATENALTSWGGGTAFTSTFGSGSCTFNYVKRIVFDRLGNQWMTPIDIIPALAAADASASAPSAGVHVPKGVCRRVGNTWTLFNNVSPGLPSVFVTDLSEDFAGRIWMSMQSNGGGAVYDNGTWAFYTPPTRPITNQLSTVFAAGEAVWFGHLLQSSFTVYSPNWLRTQTPVLGQVPGPVALSAVRTWVGIGTALAYQNANASTWTTTTLPGNTSAISSLNALSDTLVWIGTANNGIFKFANGAVTQAHTAATGLPGNKVQALLTDHLGRLWAGTDNGLGLYTESGYWLVFRTGDAPLANNNIKSLALDNANRLWIGTPTGINVLNLNNFEWFTYSTANGLPSNAINSIATNVAGETWVGTSNRLALYSAISNTWIIYSTTTGLPSNEIHHVAIDNLGRVCVATRGGVVMRENNSWKAFHVPGTMIESNRVVGLAGDANRTWIASSGSPAASSSVAVRGVLTSPIGGLVPAITSFTPISASPGAKLIINGSNFDDRGPEFNIVRFANMNGAVILPAEIVSATKTSLAVKVPAAASSGQLQVEANGLKSPLSVASFKLKPQVVAINATCVGVGSELVINGSGFLDGSAAAYVKIGGGTERIADATDPTQIRTYIRPTDTSGTIRVRLLNGNSTNAPDSLDVADLQLVNTDAQQAIDGMDMIWGKRTLFTVVVRSVGCGEAQITSATLDWKFTNGSKLPGGSIWYGSPRSVPIFPLTTSVDDAVSIIATLDLNDLVGKFGQASNASSLPYFDGISVTLRNNLVNVMTIHIPKGGLKFIDTSGILMRRFVTMAVTGDTAPEQDSNFTQVMLTNMAAAARVYPQQDVRWSNGKYYWLYDTIMRYSSPYQIDIQAGDAGNQEDHRSKVNDWLKPGDRMWGVAHIDQMNIISTSSLGLGSPSWKTVVAVNQTRTGGRLLIHEVLHAHGFVAKTASNYQASSLPGQDNHSKYDEGQWDDFVDCDTGKTFRVALTDQLGGDRRVVRISSSGAVDMIKAACTDEAGANITDTAKSVISYSPRRRNTNVIMEPVDYDTAVDQLCMYFNEDTLQVYTICPGDDGFNPLNLARAASLRAALTATRTLRLSGKVDGNGIVTPSLSYVEIDGGDISPQEPSGDLHLIVRGAGNAVLHDQQFAYESEHLTPHDNDVQRASQHVDHEDSTHVSLFNLRVPFPVGAITAEITHEGNVLWSNSVSPNTPTVNVTAPNGGVYTATQTMTATWTSSDLDNDPLQYQLDYSADGGTTWLMVEPKATGNSFTFVPNFLPASNNARIRVRVSDGFNTTSATSNPFTLIPRPPDAVILAPEGDEEYTEGEVIVLDGTSMTANGMGEGSFTWKRGNTVLGLTRTLTTTLNGIGVFTYTLQVTDYGMTGTRSTTLTVVQDYDKDKMPNWWEQQYLLNTLDPSDASADSDGDTLSNLEEYKRGTNPNLPDTDGDGFADNVEIDAGTDPLDPNNKPSLTPILNVGSTSMGFVINDYSPLPGPHHTWVTNGGGGTLNFQVSDDAPWLFVTPGAGTTAQTITVTYNHVGLPAGVYEGHVQVSAAGVSGSPHLITVTLTIEHPTLPVLYLPIIMR